MMLQVFVSVLCFITYIYFMWGFPDSSVGKESACNAGRRPWFHFWVGKIRWRRVRLPTPVFLGFPCGSAGKNPPAVWETWVQFLGSEKGKAIPGERKGYPLENSMDCIVHGVAKSWTRLSIFHIHFLMF